MQTKREALSYELRVDTMFRIDIEACEFNKALDGICIIVIHTLPWNIEALYRCTKTVVKTWQKCRRVSHMRL